MSRQIELDWDAILRVALGSPAMKMQRDEHLPEGVCTTNNQSRFWQSRALGMRGMQVWPIARNFMQ